MEMYRIVVGIGKFQKTKNMPRHRRGPSRRPYSPFDAFFDRIIDDVLDKVEDALAPTLEHLSGQVARTVKEQVDRAGAGAGAGDN